MTKSVSIIGTSVLLVGALAGVGQSADDPQAAELFVRRIKPLLADKCFACHGQDAAKFESGLDLRSRAGLLKGGDSESPALIPGEPDKSPLYLSVTRKHADWKAMPPKENDKLTAEQIGWIRDWIAGGAPWPDDAEAARIAKASAARWDAEDGISVKTSGGLSDEWTRRKYKAENLWAYQPLKKPEVPGGKFKSPIDAFVAERMPAGLAPAPPADRRTLIRRATFDLIGLLPTPEEVANFLADPLPDDRAFAKVVERLLGSPHYGEQWGQHWLDVVRYADSSGIANDYARGNAWRYRDYVVRSFNADKPYDRFIREQIAGDEIDPANPEMLIAVGFLRMGPWELTGMEVPKISRQRFLDDVTDITGQVFLGHMLQCARCHDHKFDPVPTRDYYSIQAAFATTQFAERDAAFRKDENTGGFEEKKYLEERRQELLDELAALDAKLLAAASEWFRDQGIDRKTWDEAVAEASKQEPRKVARRESAGVFGTARNKLMARGVAESRLPPKFVGFTPEEYGRERVARKGLERLRWELDRYEPLAFSVYCGRTPAYKNVSAPLRIPADRLTSGELEETAILAGGDPFSPTIKVDPGVLSAVASLANYPASEVPSNIAGRRKALAQWIASPQNPLTARVMVNRLWGWHFGSPLAGNPNNFGATGKKPTHPELLDWLAATFIERSWSIKELHRLIMASEAYQRAAAHPDPNLLAQRAPLGTSLAVFTPRRLSAEELRDAMLHITGELNSALGGIPVRPELNLEVALQPRQVMGTFAEAWQPSPLPAQRHRRTIYALKLRGQRDSLLEVFNAPGPDLSCERRETSTVTPQVFALFNSQSSLDRAVAMAVRMKKETSSREAAITRAFELVFSRPPKEWELTKSIEHWERMSARHRTLKLPSPQKPLEVVRSAVEENTGERFGFTERLHAYRDFVPDVKLADVDVETRGLAEVCLVLLNANEFVYVY